MSLSPIAPVTGAADVALAQRRRLLAARLVILVTFLDLFIQFPVVAPYAVQLGASAVMVGLIVAAYSATNLVGNLAAGLVLDRWGRSGPILAGLVAGGLALGAYALAPNAAALLVVRAVHGLATAVLTPGAFAMLGDAAVTSQRARVMGVSGALIAAAAIAGPPLAGITRDRLGVAALFIGAGGAMLVVAVLFAWLVPGRPRPTLGQRQPTDDPPRARFLAVATAPRLVTACLAAAALTVGLGILITSLPLLLAARGQPVASTGVAFSVYALVALAVMAGPVSRLSDRTGRAGPMTAGLVLVAAGLGVLGLAGDLPVIAFGMAVIGLGFGLLFPAASALVVDAAPATERGRAFGVFYAVYSLGVVVGALLSGAITQATESASGAAFYWGAATALLVSPVIFVRARRHG